MVLVLKFLINNGVAEGSTGTISFWIGRNSKNDWAGDVEEATGHHDCCSMNALRLIWLEEGARGLPPAASQ